jgi:hypothetical protein
MSTKYPFKKLRGRAILLDVPKKKDTGLHLTTKDEDVILAETIKMWNRLSVYAVGDKVEEVVPGDKVYVRIAALNLEIVERVDIDGEVKLLVQEGDIVMIW